MNIDTAEHHQDITSTTRRGPGLAIEQPPTGEYRMTDSAWAYQASADLASQSENLVSEVAQMIEEEESPDDIMAKVEDARKKLAELASELDELPRHTQMSEG